jgi:hypothetical protein
MIMGTGNIMSPCKDSLSGRVGCQDVAIIGDEVTIYPSN